MITLEDIVETINGKLLSIFPTIDINGNDVKEGFDRPSFYSKIESHNTTYYTDCKLRTMTVRIFYFPESQYNYQLDLMDKQQKLEDLLGIGFAVGDRYLKIVDGIESTETDGVLQVSIDLEFYESITRVDSTKNMQNLDTGMVI